ncbi:DUF2474 domain-containing protein [Neptunomonas phycophila]|uniref:DUF2474 domain-containing protein n=1 Tax=Neptunomonas phycophila TaxID=1572645 RepID=A0ABT9EVZ5_9GAMM|nr:MULTISPECIES: DUF2474 domain-containing protein [Neptunomonas]MBT3144855.1 DUF2474 domain-containing protein [Neptunomonas phycophila]MDN2658345.1 DUF2474 domain-containing protein [Neptunomonas sp. CHC150]MDO6785589.1 DUF2474 domain-containing protein [Neptunomonas phycophila]MDP2523234.1 DUF2474 domain-containing protein [Neptunomonas phycophila]
MSERAKENNPDQAERPVWLKRVGWLVVIWSASVAGLGVIAWLLKFFMQAAGLSP